MPIGQSDRGNFSIKIFFPDNILYQKICTHAVKKTRNLLQNWRLVGGHRNRVNDGSVSLTEICYGNMSFPDAANQFFIPVFCKGPSALTVLLSNLPQSWEVYPQDIFIV